MSDGDVNCRNASGSTPLHAAVRAGDPRTLEMVLAFRPDLNAREAGAVGESTPLHVAVHEDNAEIVEMLLKAGAKPHVQDAMGGTPLHVAARMGLERIATALVTASSAGPSVAPARAPQPPGPVRHASGPRSRRARATGRPAPSCPTRAAPETRTHGPGPHFAAAPGAGAFRYEPVPLPEILDRQGKSAHYWAVEYGHHRIGDMLPDPGGYDPLAQLELAKKVRAWSRRHQTAPVAGWLGGWFLGCCVSSAGSRWGARRRGPRHVRVGSLGPRLGRRAGR